MLKKVRTLVPEIYPFVYQCYASSSSLFFGENYTIQSQEGVQQGDPLGPFLFSLATMDLVNSCQSELKIFYLDDGTLGGDLETVLNDYKSIQASATSLGLEVNPTKCELFEINPSPNNSDNAYLKFCEASTGQCKVKLLSDHDLTLLGAPILPAAIESVLNKKLEDLKLMTDRLTEIDAHEALFLLRHCFSIPKMTYVLRTSPCFMENLILKNYDDLIKSALQKILNISLSEEPWNQCTLPINLGGLGLKMASEVSLPAFLSSAFGAVQIVKALLPLCIKDETNQFFELGCAKWKVKLNCDTLPSNQLFQSEWDKPLYFQRHKNILDTVPSSIERARILGITAEHASDFLHAIPMANLGLKLADSELRVICATRLGAPLCNQHKCSCGAEVDPMGRHGLSCKNQVGRHPRHSNVNDLVKRALSSADIPSRLEPQGLSRKDGKRPDGMTLFPYKEGRCLVWDVTVVDTLACSHIKDTAKSPGAAATKAEKIKFAKYEEIKKSYHMIPIAIETFGAWGPEGLSFIKNIGQKIKQLTGNKRSTFFLFQSISMAIQRGNAASILGTVKSGKKLDEIYYL